MHVVRRVRVFMFAVALLAPAAFAARTGGAASAAGAPTPRAAWQPTVIFTVTADADVAIRPAGALRVRTGQRVKFTVAARSADVVPVVTVDGATVPLEGARNRWLFTLAADAPHAVAVVGKPRAALHVTKTGAGTGRVTSDPHGLDCGAHCAAVFADGTHVALSATCDDPFVFRGWSGACSGTDPRCALTLAASATPTEVEARCDVPPPPAVCGNGVLEAGEQCDGLLGCPDTATCSTTCTCVDRPHDPVSSESLIAAALAAGTIDKPTALLYRAWSLFADSRLPPEYDGEVTAGEPGTLFEEINALLPSLTPDQAATLLPFVARPTEQGSYFNAQPGKAPTASDTCPVDPQTLRHDWRATGTDHFVVWACGHNSPTDDTAAQRATMGALAEQVLTVMAASLGDFMKPDSLAVGPAPTNRTDIYLVRVAQCRVREGNCFTVNREDSLAMAVATGPCETSGVGTVTTSTYVVVPVEAVPAAPLPSPWELRSSLVHEFYHAFQNAKNATAKALGCREEKVVSAGTNSWLTESTAEWSAWVFAGEDDRDRRLTLLTQFQGNRPASTTRLDTVTPRIRPYEAFLYHTFVQQQNGGTPTAEFDLWGSSAGVNTVSAFRSRFRQLFPWGGMFREFAVRNTNPGPDDFSPDDPVTPVYADLDSALERGKGPLFADGGFLLAPGMDLERPVDVVPLAAQYEVHGSGEARYVKLDFSRVPNAESLDLDVIKEVAGHWSREKVQGPVFEFCRDEEDIAKYVLVVSNHTELEGAALRGTYHVTALDHCPARWTGTIDYRCTLDKAYTRSDPFLIETGEDHREEYQTWSVLSSGTESPYPGAPETDVLTTQWQTRLTHDGLTTDAYSPCNGGEVISQQHGLAGGASDLDRIFISWNGTSISLGPAPDFPGRSPQVAGTNTVTYCGGSTIESEYTDASIDALLLVVTLPGELVEDPPGTGRYHGSLTVLDDTQEIEGGQSTVKCVETWNLQHHPASP